MTFKESIDFLHKKFGTYRKVADYLGMTENHLNALKEGRVRLPEKTKIFIIFKAEELKRKQA